VSGLNLVDSSGWMEYLAGTNRARLFADAIADVENLIVPVITVYEVVKRIRREGEDADARRAIHAMTHGRIIDIDLSISLAATQFKLPLADSIIYATAQRFGATLWTQDEDFASLADVKYFAKA
jgi:toxin FitB